MSARRFQFVFLALMGTLAVANQLSQVSQQAAASPDGKVRVYVYRSSNVAEKEFRPSVYVDEMDVARLQEGRNVILALQSGTHAFRSTDKKDQMQLDLKPGHKYYIRIDVSVVSLTGRGKLNVVLPEQGAPEFGQTKPADKSMLKNLSLIASEFVANK
jgi:hypothetical protein